MLRLIVRSFFGIGDLLGSSLFKAFVEVWFKNMEWAIIVSALLTVGLRFGSSSNLFIILGTLSAIFLFTYSTNFWASELQKEFKNSLEKVNARNIKLKLNVEPYKTFPDISAAVPIIILLLILDLLTMCAIFFAVGSLAFSI